MKFFGFSIANEKKKVNKDFKFPSCWFGETLFSRHDLSCLLGKLSENLRLVVPTSSAANSLKSYGNNHLASHICYVYGDLQQRS